MAFSMVSAGDIISYRQMCDLESVTTLQRGMNYKLNGGSSVILMSLRADALYDDSVLLEGKTIVYEGHDCEKTANCPNPKNQDQPEFTKNLKLTQNGKFKKSITDYKANKTSPEMVRVYEKIKPGIWVFNGHFNLVDYEYKKFNGRNVFKFILQLSETENSINNNDFRMHLHQTRVIPSSVKLEVWIRDRGQCVQCGSRDNLHFDHIIPFSKGGSSLVSENIQLLCARHNLFKKDKII